MEKEFTPYEQALALKELGFNEECLGTYYEEDKSFYINGVSYSNSYFTKAQELIPEHPIITAPLYQQAFRWFREKYSLNHFINSTRNEGNYKYSIYKREKSESVFPYKWNVQCYSNIDCTEYEEAELECLKKLIQIVKEQK